MQIKIVKTGSDYPQFYWLKIDKLGKVYYGSVLYKTILLEVDSCLTMRQECALRKAVDSLLFVTDLKTSEITAVSFDDRIFNLNTFLRTNWGIYG